jgi:hypothetical protein
MLVAISLMFQPLSGSAANGGSTRQPPYDAGFVCGSGYTVRNAGLEASNWCSDNETYHPVLLAKHGILQVGGIPIPGVSHTVPCPFQSCNCPTGCPPPWCWFGCVPIPCCLFPPDGVGVGLPGEPAPEAAHALARIVPRESGLLTVSALVSGQSLEGACMVLRLPDAIVPPTCTEKTMPEGNLTLAAAVRARYPVWVEVWIDSPGSVVVREISHVLSAEGAK